MVGQPHVHSQARGERALPCTDLGHFLSLQRDWIHYREAAWVLGSCSGRGGITTVWRCFSFIHILQFFIFPLHPEKQEHLIWLQASAHYSLLGFSLVAYESNSITNICSFKAMVVALLACFYSDCAYCISQNIPRCITEIKYFVCYQVHGICIVLKDILKYPSPFSDNSPVSLRLLCTSWVSNNP